MKQADLGLILMTKRMRKREFLTEIECVMPWATLVSLITPYAPEGKRGRQPFSVETILRIRFMLQWFTLSDPAMEESLRDDVPLLREFANFTWDSQLPDETTILRLRRCLEDHKLGPQILALVKELLGAKGLLLRVGTVVDVTLIAVPRYLGMKAHIGVDADSGLVHTVRGAMSSVNDVVEANTLFHGEATEAWRDTGYQDATKPPGAKKPVRGNIAMRPGKRKLLDKAKLTEDPSDQLKSIEVSIRDQLEHPFRVINRQFGLVEVRYSGLAKNMAQLYMPSGLPKLWMGRQRLMRAQA